MVENDLDYLKTYDQIQSTKVRWIWYPYIPLSKITLLQGDPGDGKSTMMLNLISELSRGGQLPDGTKVKEPLQSIYQCSEDGVADYESEYDESQLNDLKSDLYAYIENELNPYIAELEALSYRYGKDGGPDITADFVCEFCGKDGVSVLEEFYPVGYCCFCGNENSYRECQICGKIYDYDSEDKDFCPECRPRDLDDE